LQSCSLLRLAFDRTNRVSGTLPTYQAHMETSDREPQLLLLSEALHHLHGDLWLGARCRHLVLAALRRLETPAETDAQDSYQRHLRVRPTVRESTGLVVPNLNNMYAGISS